MALLRGSRGLLDPRHAVVKVEIWLLPPLTTRPRLDQSQWWRLHEFGPGTGPVITDLPERLCRCGLDLVPPADLPYWLPHVQPEPVDVHAVAIRGEEPIDRHAVRCDGGWREKGHKIHFPVPGGLVQKWQDVGRCWADGLHPVRALGL